MSAAEDTKPVEAVAAEAPAQAADPTKVNDSVKVEEPVKKEETEVKLEESEAKPEEKDDVLKTTAQIDPNNHSNNVKFDASVLKETDDPVEIRKQVWRVQ